MSELGQFTRLDQNYMKRSLLCPGISLLFSGQIFPSSLVRCYLMFVGVTDLTENHLKGADWFQPLGNHSPVQQGWVGSGGRLKSALCLPSVLRVSPAPCE